MITIVIVKTSAKRVFISNSWYLTIALAVRIKKIRGYSGKRKTRPESLKITTRRGIVRIISVYINIMPTNICMYRARAPFLSEMAFLMRKYAEETILKTIKETKKNIPISGVGLGFPETISTLENIYGVKVNTINKKAPVPK